jgi:iron complex transport system ATP-binding protein
MVSLPIISASGIISGYAGKAVLHDVSVEIQAGDFYGVIGPNGSGKSTLLKTLTGIIKPMSGLVQLYGRDIGEMSPREIARKVAAIPQEVSVLFPFTSREIVAMGRHPHIGRFRRETSADLAVVEGSMRDTDTSLFADRYVDELSGGERQRVIIARALCQEPEVLFLDEPTSHLDINHQVEVFELLTELNRKRNLAVVVISHDLNICAEYCRELLIIKEGRIFRRGEPKNILTEEIVREVYGAEVSILTNPRSEAPVVTIVPRGTR